MTSDGRTFIVTLHAAAGTAGIRALRDLLKAAGRRHGLRAIDIQEKRQPSAGGGDGEHEDK